MGNAPAVHRSDERKGVLEALAKAGGPLSPQEIMDATGRTDSNAVHQLLFRMVLAGEIEKVSRGRYVSASSKDDKDGKGSKDSKNGKINK